MRVCRCALGPVCGYAQYVSAAVVDEPGGHGEQFSAGGGGNGEFSGVLGVSEACGPAGEVVSQCGAREPGAVAREVP